MQTDFLSTFCSTTKKTPYESIRRSIEALLNAREGNVSYPSCFGVPDFMDSISSMYAEKLKNMVIRKIKLNEPRIKNILCESINHTKSLSATRYELLVTLKTDETFDLRIEVSGFGQFYVHI